MAQARPPVISLEKAANVLFALLDRSGVMRADELSAATGLPSSTTYRYLDSLVSSGLIVRIRRGEYAPSPQLLYRTERYDFKATFAAIARPVLQQLTAKLEMTSHLGVLENEMVTYVVKSTARGADVFTREGGQLEAYCSGIGKVLLAALPDAELERYLAGGPFPRLTESTLTDPQKIRKELAKVRRHEFAVDAEEVSAGLNCIAVPLKGAQGRAIAAISVSSLKEHATVIRKRCLPALKEAAAQIGQRLGH